MGSRLSKRPIIALLGNRGAGKAHVATYLQRQHGFTMINMATPVERMLHAGLGIDPLIFGTDAQRLPMEGAGGASAADLKNSLFHDWGRRQVHGSLWAKGWGRIVDDSAATGIVVKDAGYPAEFRQVRERGGVLWRIERPGVIASRTIDEVQSELDVDHTIINRGDDPAVLHRLIDVAISTLGGVP